MGNMQGEYRIRTSIAWIYLYVFPGTTSTLSLGRSISGALLR